MPNASPLLLRILVSTLEVKRYIRLVTDNPAVMWDRWNVEKMAGAEWNDTPVFKRSGSLATKDKPNVFDGAARQPEARPNMRRPLPARLIRRATDRHAAQAHDFVPAERHESSLVRLLKSFENHVDVHALLK